MVKEFIFVTGYFGAPTYETAKTTAIEKGYRLLDLDKEIEKNDGRSVLRICMVMGEHEYRNREYEILSKLVSDTEFQDICPDADSYDGLVIYCGDGVLNDEMSRNIITQHHFVISGSDMTEDELWQNAKKIKEPTHAFMHFGTEETKRKAFKELHIRQKELFGGVLNDL